MSRLDVAIGVVAKAPEPGFVKTRLTPPLSAHQAAEVYRALLFDTLGAIERSHASKRVLLAAPERDGVDKLAGLIADRNGWSVVAQRGGDLGERLDHGIEDLLATGVRGAVIVSSDTPFLDAGEIDEASEWLVATPGRSLFGPACDGGYYLIGLTRPDPSLFRGIAWSTPGVGAMTLQRMNDAGLDVRKATTRFDIDDAADLARWRGRPHSEAPSWAAEMIGTGLW